MSRRDGIEVCACSIEVPQLSKVEGTTVTAHIYPGNSKLSARVGYDLGHDDEADDITVESWDAEVAALLVKRNRLLVAALYAAKEYHAARDRYGMHLVVPMSVDELRREGQALWSCKDAYDAAMAELPKEVP